MRLIWLLFLLKGYFQVCRTGCLICSTDDKCLFCDNTNNYVLNSSSECTQIQIDNCSYIEISGQCQKCSKNYFLNSSNACVYIENTNRIDHCIIHSSASACQLCEQFYYVQNGSCLKVTNIIQNCEIYASDTTCSKCANKYILSSDKLLCKANSGINYCSSYNSIHCKQCSAGYYFTRSYLYEYFKKVNTSTKREEISKLLIANRIGNNQNIYINRCLQENVDNCNIFQAWDQCQVCDDNYYINEDNKCTVNPTDRINNCQTYKDKKNCSKCVNSYYLQNHEICSSVTTINQCLEYDGTATDTRCLKCYDGYYSQSSKCTIRDNSKNVNNCSVYVPDDDLCKECIDGYLIATSGLQCFAKIQNCSEHSLNSGGIQCTQCSSGYYLVNGSTCAAGSVQNCDKYGTSQTVCQQCKNGYYLDGEFCTAHTIITNCESYSPSAVDTCILCGKSSFRFSVEKVCVDGTQISNCASYSGGSTITCLSCIEGYYLDTNSYCQVIPISNCSQYSRTTQLCTGCATNYLLSNNQKECIEIFKSIQKNCIETNLTDMINQETIATSKCMKCSDYTYPIDNTDLYVCTDQNDLTKLDITLKEDSTYCKQYDDSGNCVSCIDGRYLLNGQCETSCGNYPYRIFIYGMRNTTEIMITGQRRCYTDTNTFTNASVLGIDLSQQTSISNLDIIIKCNSSSLPVITLPQSVSDFDQYNRYHAIDLTQSNENLVNAPVSQFPAFSSCVSSTTSTNSSTDVAPIVSNCAWYHQFTINGITVYRCIRCIFGYTSVIKTDDNKSYYLSQCISATYCKTQQQYGLSQHWEKLISCHVCKDSGKIPFLAVEMIKNSQPYPKGLRQYSLTSINHTQTPNSTLQNVICIEDSLSSLGYDTTNTGQTSKFQNLPSNCGIGIINLSVTNGDSTQNQTQIDDSKTVALAHFCGGCSPSYKPTYLNSIYKHVIVKCDAISNCSGKNWFNSCSQCDNNYVFYSSTTGPIDYQQCIQNTISNCYASNGSTACIFCKKGYILNNDGICDQITPPYCSSAKYFNYANYYSKNLYSYSMYYQVFGIGCTSCDSGYVSILLNTQYVQSFICSESVYIQDNNTNFPQDSIYINHCSNYGFKDNSIVCKECEGSYILSQDQLKCYNGPTGCYISEGESSCVQCVEGRYLVNGLCESNPLSYCLKSENSINSTSARCQQCNINYYLTQSYTCERGNVLHCSNFVQGNPQQCNQCESGYVLLNKSPADFCYKIPSSAKCETALMTSSSTKGAIFQCNSCVNSYDYLSTESSNIGEKSQCLEFDEIDQCASYIKGDTLDQSTFLCSKCNDEYYLNNDSSSCIARTDYSTNCSEYKIDEDNCITCIDGYFVDTTGICIQNPSGVQFCYKYENETNCIVCDEGYYLLNNACVEISANDEIVNCKNYAEINTCYECKSGYILISNVCEIAEAQLCKTYLSATACASCETNYVLVDDDNGIINCVYKTKQNCVEISESGPSYQCLTCNTGFYSDSDGECQRVTTTISNCKVYSTFEDCSQCAQGYVLANDLKTCIPVSTLTISYDSNCSDYTVDIECAICDPGYYIQNEQCVECDSSNCYFCNPVDSSKCLICKPGTYMNSSQTCIGSVTPDPSINWISVLNIGMLYLLLQIIQIQQIC